MQQSLGQKETIFCGIDLGSNSFHMVIARVNAKGRFTFIDRRKEYVRLAGGLLPDGTIEPETRSRALECLSRFKDRLSTLPERHIRVVATNTFRKAKDPGFFREAQECIGRTIHVVSGLEEARWYRGVVSNRDEVVGIGGASSLSRRGDRRGRHHYGLWSWTLRFFPDGMVTSKAERGPLRDERLTIRRFRGRQCPGSSEPQCHRANREKGMGWSDEGITETAFAVSRTSDRRGRLDKRALRRFAERCKSSWSGHPSGGFSNSRVD